MVWIIVGVILIAAFGPIFYLRPSPRDKQVAKAREAARRAGLVVEMARLEKLNATAPEKVSAGGKARDASYEVATYRRRLPRTTIDPPVWKMIHAPNEKRLVGDRVPDFRMQNVPKNVPEHATDYWQRIADLTETAPDGTRAMEAHVEAVRWIGVEAPGGADAEAFVDSVVDFLDTWARIHAEVVETEVDSPPG